jgi:hypothetical protein
MGIFTGGGSQVGSAQINDGAIVNADVNAAAGIAQSKIAGNANAAGDIVSVETTAGVTHALTTLAGERVLVIAKGNLSDGTGTARTISLNYNGVAQDSVVTTGGGSATRIGFCLTYTAIHGADTQNITVTTTGGALENVDIMVLKLK